MAWASDGHAWLAAKNATGWGVAAAWDMDIPARNERLVVQLAGALYEAGCETALLCDIFGPLPFRPVTIDPSVLAWNAPLVPRLAQAIYDKRRWGDMPILGDALLDAGCGDEGILAHCRSGGEHVRGCWVVDLLLGKE